MGLDKRGASARAGMVLFGLFLALLAPGIQASTGDDEGVVLDLTTSWVGILALVIFTLGYLVVISEEYVHIRKSKPTIVAAGLIWLLIGGVYAYHGDQQTAAEAFRHNLLEFAELFLFLLVAMTYINTMRERQLFDALRVWLVNKGLSLKGVFWITGLLAFVISPLADNLTTALLMGAVVIAVGGEEKKFVGLACINIVVAANAGGAFSPFGDITTLMVWQAGLVEFQQFLVLFVPSLINWLVPAGILSMAIHDSSPSAEQQSVEIKKGGFFVTGLFLLTIAMAVCAHSFLHMPPVLGMMTGLGFLMLYGFYLSHHHPTRRDRRRMTRSSEQAAATMTHQRTGIVRRFHIYHILERAEWDTLMFFYGIILAVGGLGTLGYLALLSEQFYGTLGPTWANILVGVLSAIIDNIPVMFAVITMSPDMGLDQWLLVTLTAGVGGSLLSVGSAAGVALMGQARGVYTFTSHLRWSWAIALGYILSVLCHLWLNG